ncbi:MAG: aminotransferase class I/II-fold pyridoxal phosphate-dependent enzyme [Planctomycetes bacterium]|nr:aminotransferase class I/II-fold pyridoxal phosphate-dependent enzyme [Planctomycetota bacterium]
MNTPGNPTGVGLNKKEIYDLVDLLNRYPDLIVISDEIYRLFNYDSDFISLAQLRDNVITLDGFSKSHSVTGWRVGWASGPKKIIQEMAKLQQFTFVCAPSFAQQACIEALKTPMDDYVDEYRQKRDFIYENLKSQYTIAKPDGTFYIFPKVPESYASGQAFVEEALKHNLLIIPGNVFSEKDSHFRISFATSQENLQQGVDILNEMA